MSKRQPETGDPSARTKVQLRKLPPREGLGNNAKTPEVGDPRAAGNAARDVPLGRPRFLTAGVTLREPMTMTTFKIPVSLLERLKAEAHRRQTSVSQLMREALTTALEG